MKTLSEMLKNVARREADRPAIVQGERRWTYEDLDERVERFAALLARGGVHSGDRVAILLPNSMEYVLAFFGSLRAGAIVVPFNESYQVSELTFLLERCGVLAIITDAEHEALCKRVVGGLARACRVLLLEEGDKLPAAQNLPFLKDASQPVMYQFSSGSTGQPKQIARSHEKLLFELDSLKRTLDLGPEDRFLGVAPFTHVNGLVRSMIASVRVGATLYPLKRFDRQAVVRTIEQERITTFIAVPFMFSILAKTPFRDPPDFSSLQRVISASAPMPVELNREFKRKFGRHVRQLYGSTETGTISVNLSERASESLDSVGTPILGVEVEVHSEEGNPVEEGEMGEFVVRSPAAMEHYLFPWQANESAFREDFFLTGDLGIRRRGLLYLLGRKKFFINKGGYKINPGEIEELLMEHPAVEEAAVVGVPTRLGDERIKAVVKLKEPCSESELLEHCRGEIADFKVPSVVEFIDELPKTSTGKIRKQMLIES